MPGHAAHPFVDIHAARGCRYCAEPLTAIERVRGDICGRLACRRRLGNESQSAARAADLNARCAAATPAWRRPAILAAPVVWLQPHAARLVRIGAAARAAYVNHLQTLVGTGPAEATAPTAPELPSSGEAALAARVCAFCAGRCCRHGALAHAFVDRALLQRRADASPGRTLADAAADYVSRLPTRHIEGSCLHHGSAGCTLPRTMRSAVCNRHACAGLVEAQLRVDDGAPHGLVVAMGNAGAVGRAAWLTENETRRLTRRPGRAA